MANARLTKLNAVNTILSVIGESPVNTLNDATITTSVILAKKMLDDISLEVQTIGWSFNTEYNFPMVPDVDGHINLPINCLAIDVENNALDVVERSGRLYSRAKRTDVFTDTLNASMTLLLEFEELPEAAKRFIMIRAARIYQDRFLGGNEIHIYTQQDEAAAKAALQYAEAEAADYTVFDSPDTYGILNRRIN